MHSGNRVENGCSAGERHGARAELISATKHGYRIYRLDRPMHVGAGCPDQEVRKIGSGRQDALDTRPPDTKSGHQRYGERTHPSALERRSQVRAPADEEGARADEKRRLEMIVVA